MTEQFSPEERAALSPYFTNLDGPVFALVSLPEVVKGALFARYSRSPKSLRRLFLDEFLADVGRIANVGEPLNFVKTSRAEELYGRMFFEYGDDSVAQLGGVHLACEGASNILTKVLEWGRLAAYLEQSTRYVPYDDLVGGRYRYHVPRELDGELRARYLATLDAMFDTYRELLPILHQHFTERFPKDEQTSDGAYRMSIRAKALDTLRGLLPAATTSNVGIYGTGQAYENLLLRMRAHPLLEVRAYAGLMLEELRKVIPAFLRRVDLPDRGGAWSDYLEDTRRSTSRVAAALVADESELSRDEVTLTDFDPDGETKVVAAALYAVSNVPDDRLL
jgi:thymidylate synthase ThyX